MKAFFLLCFLCLFAAIQISAQPVWESKFDSKVQFYQTTDFGVMIVGTDKSLYAVDGQTGEIVWRRKHKGLDETSISPIPDTDLILLSLDEGDKSRLEAIDLISGETLWRSEKVKGDVMQLAIDASQDLLCVVLVKKAKAKIGDELKRKPLIHTLQLSTGKQIWKREIDSDVVMMPAEFVENKERVAYTLDNYRPPMILDGKMYIFYEGSTILNAQTGKEIEREKFKVNEDGLASTEADVVVDQDNVYFSGRGRIRAVNRQTGKTVWKADDLGVTPEMVIVANILYVRTGGQFTRLKDGQIEEKGKFGVSAIDTKNGKVLWRFQGADRGITNFIVQERYKLLVADRDDLIQINTENGKILRKWEHKIEKAQFIIRNERGHVVVGGSEEIAAFDVENTQTKNQNQAFWRVKHKAPGRGILRIVGAVVLRATALYFRYGGFAVGMYTFASNSISLANTIGSFRLSGLKTRFGSYDLTSLATNYARNYVSDQIRLYGIASRVQDINGLRIQRPNLIGRFTPTRAEVEEKLFDRLDPTRQLDKLSGYLLKRKTLAQFRGNFMYFYTDLPKRFDKNGLIGVNVQTGEDTRFIPVGEPDSRFTTDESTGLFYTADGNRLRAFDLLKQ